MSDYIPPYDAFRDVQDRESAQLARRQARDSGTIDRTTSMKLDLPAEMLDLPNNVYRWVNDTDDNIRVAQVHKDYDFVNPDSLNGYSSDRDGGESDARIRKQVDNYNGHPVYAYLMAKKREWWEEDNERLVQARQEQLKGIVRGEEEVPGAAPGKTYTSKNNKMGGAAQELRGPIVRK